MNAYSEEISPTGRQIGNFPHASSHLAIIAETVNLHHQLDPLSGLDRTGTAHRRAR